MRELLLTLISATLFLGCVAEEEKVYDSRLLLYIPGGPCTANPVPSILPSDTNDPEESYLSDRLLFWESSGWVVSVVDYRKPCTQGISGRALEEAFIEIVEKHVQNELDKPWASVVVYAESLGGYLAQKVDFSDTSHTPDLLVLSATMYDLNQLIDYKESYTNRSEDIVLEKFSGDVYDPVRTLEDLCVVVSHARNDPLVPLSLSPIWNLKPSNRNCTVHNTERLFVFGITGHIVFNQFEDQFYMNAASRINPWLDINGQFMSKFTFHKEASKHPPAM